MIAAAVLVTAVFSVCCLVAIKAVVDPLQLPSFSLCNLSLLLLVVLGTVVAVAVSHQHHRLLPSSASSVSGWLFGV